jgi:hypothetical protein
VVLTKVSYSDSHLLFQSALNLEVPWFWRDGHSAQTQTPSQDELIPLLKTWNQLVILEPVGDMSWHVNRSNDVTPQNLKFWNVTKFTKF